jgi:hypothetical protein
MSGVTRATSRVPAGCRLIASEFPLGDRLDFEVGQELVDRQPRFVGFELQQAFSEHELACSRGLEQLLIQLEQLLGIFRPR